MARQRESYIDCPGCGLSIPVSADGTAHCHACGAELPGYDDPPDDDDDSRSENEEYGDALEALEAARDELARLREEKAQLDARIAEARAAVKACRQRIARA
jgi:hypothetical protein